MSRCSLRSHEPELIGSTPVPASIIMNNTELVEKAITGKWHLIAYGLGVSKGKKNCIFCQHFYDNDCVGCPVTIRNNNYYKCKNTPCRRVITETILNISISDVIDAVEDQIHFLCSLLPKNHEWYEEYH